MSSDSLYASRRAIDIDIDFIIETLLDDGQELGVHLFPEEIRKILVIVTIRFFLTPSRMESPTSD